jgi:glycosyltransferase involved in cell wall biosynthesis
MPDIGVIGLVPDAWGGPWMPREHVLTRLAKYFHVVWMDPARGWREHWVDNHSPGERAEKDSDDQAGLPPGFTVYRPGKFLPLVYRPRWLSKYLASARIHRAAAILRAKGCRRIVLYLWRPEFDYALDAVQHDLSCYHIDDEYSFADVEVPQNPAEAALIQRAGHVIIHSPALMEKKGHLNAHSALIPNGVAYNIFANSVAEPADLRDVPHPRIGYAGMIKKQLNLDLLLELAKRHREWNFVMVGPLGMLKGETQTIEALSRLPNVHFLGRKRWDELPGYMQHMDVCTLCYKLNDYTKYIYPLKLHEYLAAGRPVVAAPIRSLLEFGGDIKLAETADEWSDALRTSLDTAEATPERIAARRQIAKSYDWDDLVEKIAALLCDRLGENEISRFAKLFGADLLEIGSVEDFTAGARPRPSQA